MSTHDIQVIDRLFLSLFETIKKIQKMLDIAGGGAIIYTVSSVSAHFYSKFSGFQNILEKVISVKRAIY
ncbi:MAG: hypothetical protein LBH74_05695 [Nitrososphaerota archaeon]|jgi:hypothetical protein|nr:hypothetical protein [Nitrososphaerota archaeon]